jgi:hypothetical protein
MAAGGGTVNGGVVSDFFVANGPEVVVSVKGITGNWIGVVVANGQVGYTYSQESITLTAARLKHGQNAKEVQLIGYRFVNLQGDEVTLLEGGRTETSTDRALGTIDNVATIVGGLTGVWGYAAEQVGDVLNSSGMKSIAKGLQKTSIGAGIIGTTKSVYDAVNEYKQTGHVKLGTAVKVLWNGVILGLNIFGEVFPLTAGVKASLNLINLGIGVYDTLLDVSGNKNFD